ncbi:hypothetical protein B0H10DRAFT_1939616 [Mycena sp. CBHHK59/15]|nr:hypothetical protein B0H10DRAFT_1939616 [Mycena sp. CBHHK59/15]
MPFTTVASPPNSSLLSQGQVIQVPIERVERRIALRRPVDVSDGAIARSRWELPRVGRAGSSAVRKQKKKGGGPRRPKVLVHGEAIGEEGECNASWRALCLAISTRITKCAMLELAFGTHKTRARIARRGREADATAFRDVAQRPGSKGGEHDAGSRMSRAEAFKNKKRKRPAAIGSAASAGSGAVSDVHTHSLSLPLESLTGPKEDDPIIAVIHCVSEDNRRNYQEEISVEPGSPVKRARCGFLPIPVAPAPSTDGGAPVPEENFDAERYEMGFEADDKGLSVPRTRLPRIVKPLDCFGDDMLCSGCMVDRHVENPLHRIERWNKRYFEDSSLKELGLRVQLGHRPRERCSEPKQLHAHFVVLHTNGHHDVAVDCCDCENSTVAGTEADQLLQAGWTCATLAVLDQFILSTHQAKNTMYDFYAMLEKLTNNAGVKPPNRYHAWLRMCREYRHLLMLKRAGRGHDPTGVEGTKPGELAVVSVYFVSGLGHLFSIEAANGVQ